MKNKIISFCWQHLLLLISLWVMTLGIALCVKSMLGSSVISVLPYVFEYAGMQHLAPELTIGQYTYIINGLFVVGQILILRRQFAPIQLLQVLMGLVFGTLIDVNMWLVSSFQPSNIWQEVLSQFAGCTILGLGIAMEVRCGSITMPGEGLPVAISRVSGIEFPKAKIAMDCTLVVLGIGACYLFFGQWQWHIIGIGTLFAMFYVGYSTRVIGHHMAWFERLLAYRPGFRRYIFGLARHIYKHGKTSGEPDNDGL